MNTPAISIVMPVYNAAGYLCKSIESILSQTQTDFELIIIDDGSTDNSKNIVKSYLDNRIILIENSHDFIRSLNTGIDASKGKYIVRMDADDLMLPYRLEVQFQYMEDNPDIDVCGSWMETFSTESRIIKTPVKHKDIVLHLIERNSLSHPTIIMRKESLQRSKSYPNLYKSKYIYAEDYKLWVDLIKDGLKFANIPEVLLQYRISQGQTSYRHSKRQINNTFLIQRQYIKYVSNQIVQEEPDLYEYFDNSIQLLNKGRLTFNCFKTIVFELYASLLLKNQTQNIKKLPMEGPPVSVVMPVYNVENYIKESIDSILSQTYPNLEFIIINDGSIDNTASIIKSIRDNRIIFIDHSEKKGNYARRNEGCKLAKGKYICVMDGDDVAMPERIEKQIEIMENDSLLLAHGTAFVFSNGNTCHKPYSYNLIKVMLLFNNVFLHPSLIIRKEVMESIGFYNEKYLYASDYDLICKIALKGKVINIPDVFMKYRVHEKQISSAHHVKQAEYASQIRLDYLKKCGFRLSTEEKGLFTLIMIKSDVIKKQNIDIYLVIKSLKEQNLKLKYFDMNIFNLFWEHMIKDIYVEEKNFLPV